VEEWIRSRVDPVGVIEVAHERPWSTVLRVPGAEGTVWFKACSAVQAFEPRLTASLYRRWRDRVAEVLDFDDKRGWLLLADGGVRVVERGNPPEDWLVALPAYAELQRGEAEHALDHLAHGVPDLRLEALPARFDGLLGRDLPLTEDERRRLRRFEPQFRHLCHALSTHGIPSSVQHDDLHHNNLYVRDGRLRVLDWGDSSISHPFASLVVTFRFLEEFNGMTPDDPWFVRLRDAYLEPWGADLANTFALAFVVGTIAHAIAWVRQREHLAAEERAGFDPVFRVVLERALACAERREHS
jgi:hypothetical protein